MALAGLDAALLLGAIGTGLVAISLVPAEPQPTGSPGGPNPTGDRNVPPTPPLPSQPPYLPPEDVPYGAGTRNACLQIPPGNTVLDFSVGYAPTRQLGTPVVYWGQLSWVYVGPEGFVTRAPITGEAINFVDPEACASYGLEAATFQSILTDQEGRFVLLRPLEADELDGYEVFAYYEGKSLVVGPFGLEILNPSMTGTWTVVPQ